MNTNCLAGIQCPNCKQEGAFFINFTATALVTDDGAETVSDTEWDTDSLCMCTECKYRGLIKAFMEADA